MLYSSGTSNAGSCCRQHERQSVPFRSCTDKVQHTPRHRWSIFRESMDVLSEDLISRRHWPARNQSNCISSLCLWLYSSNQHLLGSQLELLTLLAPVAIAGLRMRRAMPRPASASHHGLRMPLHLAAYWGLSELFLRLATRLGIVFDLH